MSQNQIRAPVREYHSPEYLCCLLASGFLGRLCLSGDPSKLTEENFAVVREGGLFVSGLTDFCGLAVVTKV